MTVGSKPTTFTHLSAKPLHPTFGAEIRGLDFRSSFPSDGAVNELIQAVAKVCLVSALHLSMHPVKYRNVFTKNRITVWYCCSS